MKKNRLIILASLALVSALIFAGCGQGTAGTDAQSKGQQNQDEGRAQTQGSASAANEENAIYGNVTAIDGSTITLQLGALNQNEPAGGQDGTPPSGAGQGGGQDAGQPSKMPSGLPSGAQASALPSNGQRPSMLTLTDETRIITIPDESIVTVAGRDNQDTGLGAIQVGSTLKVVYAQDGAAIQSVVVMNAGGFTGKESGGSAPSAS
jgi:hypothetical protein